MRQFSLESVASYQPRPDCQETRHPRLARKRLFLEAMKLKGCREIVIGSALVCVAVSAVEPPAPKPVATLRTDAVKQVQNEDSVFSLLIQAYRQRQQVVIKQDYQKRLEAAGKLANPQTRLDVQTLAAQERDARFDRLEAQVESFMGSYEVNRKDSVRAKGIEAPSNVDTNAAAVTLKTYVEVRPQVPSNEK